MKMVLTSPYIWYYTASLAALLACIISAGMRWFHVCDPYKSCTSYYFPARKPITGFFLIQIFQLPYLLNITSPLALKYILTFDLLTLIPMAIITWERYFLLKPITWFRVVSLFTLPACIIFPMLIFSMFPHMLSGPEEQVVDKWIYSVTGVAYFIQILFMTESMIKIRRLERYRAYNELSNVDHVRKPFTKRVIVMMVILMLIMLLTYILSSPLIKMIRDVLVAVFIPIFTIVCFDLRRNLSDAETQDIVSENKPSVSGLSNDAANMLAEGILREIEAKELYRDVNIKVADLATAVGTNRAYVSAVINSIMKSNFYDLMNGYRVEFAKQMMKEKSDVKLTDVAKESGFSSPVTFTRIFKKIEGIAPSEWKQQI